MLLADTLESTLLALPLLLLLVGGGAGLITRTGLAPLRRFNQLVSSVGAKTLDQRSSRAVLPGELVDLANAFNAMLARIDAGYRQLEEFAGDLAHEMRTPVATLLGRTQVALSKALYRLVSHVAQCGSRCSSLAHGHVATVRASPWGSRRQPGRYAGASSVTLIARSDEPVMVASRDRCRARQTMHSR
jgi:signal transduction histidine kinase